MKIINDIFDFKYFFLSDHNLRFKFKNFRSPFLIAECSPSSISSSERSLL